MREGDGVCVEMRFERIRWEERMISVQRYNCLCGNGSNVNRNWLRAVLRGNRLGIENMLISSAQNLSMSCDCLCLSAISGTNLSNVLQKPTRPFLYISPSVPRSQEFDMFRHLPHAVTTYESSVSTGTAFCVKDANTTHHQ